MHRLLLATLAVSATAALIASVPVLNQEIRSNGGKVGFLSRANYEAVQSVLPKEVSDNGTLEVVVITHTEDIENSVKNGSLLAGLYTSCPTNDDGAFITFGSGQIAPRASFFTTAKSNDPLDSGDLRRAWDAAIVRAIGEGDYEAIESQYYASNQFDSVGAFTCSISATDFPFPVAANATGLLRRVLDSKILTMASLGPFNWGYQGNYLESPLVGLWPDYAQKIFNQFNEAYGNDIVLERKFYPGSTQVMNSVLNGTSDLTEPYWTVSATHEGEPRTQNFDFSCTVLGTESCFFTASDTGGGSSGNDDDNDKFPSWAIAVIIILSLLSIGFLAFICTLISKEKNGKPLFYSPLKVHETKGQKESISSVVAP